MLIPTIHKQVVFSDNILGNFNSEKEIENYIHKNVKDFMSYMFEERATKVTKQPMVKGLGLVEIKPGQLIQTRGMRADLYVECESGNNYLFEMKNKGSQCSALGQILTYSYLYPQANKLVILSARLDEGVLGAIYKFNLPVTYILFGKKGIFEAKYANK